MGKPVRAEVSIKQAKTFDRMLRRFIKKVKKERIIETVKENMYYEKPSVARRRKKENKKQTSKKLEKAKRLR